MTNKELITSSALNRFDNRIIHFTTTRAGGISKNNHNSLNLSFFCGDNPVHVATNRDILCEKLNINPEHLITAKQTHGIGVKLVDKQTIDQYNTLDGYDALITKLPNICITVSTADCVPILLFDPTNNAIAAIHSGWRSTAENICQLTIDKMAQQFGSQPEDIVAAICPCISGDKYEVGEELFTEFQTKNFEVDLFFTPIANKKFLFNIRKAVRRQLESAGIKNIETSDLCTFSHEDLFFSARRMGTNSGRMLSGILLK